jgi:hypothetical protein
MGRMSARRLLRIVGSIVVIYLLWTRMRQRWGAGVIALSAILILVVIVEVTGVQQKWRRLRDQVPKKPLGLGE